MAKSEQCRLECFMRRGSGTVRTMQTLSLSCSGAVAMREQCRVVCFVRMGEWQGVRNAELS
eukprot:13234708-Alexandrium_andersonii.AAC.1